MTANVVVHLTCGLGNRLFAIMRMLHKYKNGVAFVWEPLGSENVQFADLFYAPELNITFIPYSSRTTIQIDEWISSETRKTLNLTGKLIAPQHGIQRTYGCCLCGFPRCDPNIARLIHPNPNIAKSIRTMIQYMDPHRNALHIRNSPEANFLYSTSQHRIRKEVQKNYSYISFQRQKDYEFFRTIEATNTTLVQDDFRVTYRGRDTKQELLSSVFDMYALSYAKSITQTKVASSFSKFSSCLAKSRSHRRGKHL